jgi:hypothetical protein
MLDPCFKSLDVVKAFVGWAKMIQIMDGHDKKNLLPLLVVDFYFVNPTTNDLSEATPIDDDSIFGIVTSNVTILHGLLNNELGLFYHLHVKL